MAGSVKNYSRKRAQRELDKEYPGAFLIPRSPINSEAIIAYKDGTVIARGGSNYKAMEDLTNPERSNQKQPKPLIEEDPIRQLKTRRENRASDVIYNLNEVLVIGRAQGKKIYLEYDQEGLVSKIKIGDEEFTPK